MVRAPALLVLCLAPVWAAHAQDDATLPIYDVSAYCERLAQAEGDDGFIREDCLEQEQRCHDKLVSAWSSIPDRMRATCEEMARSEGSSYTTLYYCLVAEYEGAQGYSPF